MLELKECTEPAMERVPGLPYLRASKLDVVLEARSELVCHD